MGRNLFFPLLSSTKSVGKVLGLALQALWEDCGDQKHLIEAGQSSTFCRQVLRPLCVFPEHGEGQQLCWLWAEWLSMPSP